MQKLIKWLAELGLTRAGKSTKHAEYTLQDNAEARYLVELADLRQREKALIERAVDVVCTIDSTGSFVFVSPSCKTWGYATQELQGKSARVVVDEEGFKRILNYANEADKSIEKVMFETQISCKDGSTKHAAWRGQWSISEKTLFCIVHDMTEQKQIEQALRASEQQLKEILETLPAGVVIMTHSGIIEFANAAAERLLLRDKQSIVGQSTDSLFSADFPAQQNRLDLNDRIVCRADKSSIPVETHTQRIELGGQEKQILLFVDKSAHYDFERTKQEFFTMVAHDFRAPLTSLKNLVVLIEDGVLDKQSEQGTRVSEQVSLECSQLLRLVQDMVDIGKMGTNTFVLDSGFGEAGQLIQSAVEGSKHLAERNNIKITVPKASATYFGDEQRLNQVLTNLITNAIKHSKPDSQVEIQIADDSQNDCVRFSVKDCGPGIPADKREKVFEMYEQLPGASGKPSTGTGLGLAICKLIVQHHGGQIGVESKQGEGSLFWFTISKSSPQHT